MRAQCAIIVFGFIAGLAACDVGRPELGVSAGRETSSQVLGMPPPNPFDSNYGGHQGVALEGGRFEGQRLTFPYSSARDPDGQPYTTVSLDGGNGTELVAHRGTDEFRGPDLVGTTFIGTVPDGGMYTVRITDYSEHVDPRDGLTVSDYRVKLDTGEDLCSTMDPPVARPVDGSWTLDGLHDLPPTPTKFQFACSDGVIFKCIDFGYKPWGVMSGPTIGQPLSSTTKTGVDLHQTCTRMARADYCADGKSHTMNETFVHYYDIFRTMLPGVSPTTLDLDRYDPDPMRQGDRGWDVHFEAAWRPGYPIEGQRQSAAICLTKKRWKTIPLGQASYCPTLLPDPRTEDGAHFCEDIPEVALEGSPNGALLFNDSSFIDLGLYRWLPGPDNYTTSHFPDLGPVLTMMSPPGGFPLPPNPPPRFEGAVFNYATHYLPSGLINLCTYQDSSGNPVYLTTTNISNDCLPAPPGFVSISPDPSDPDPREGKIYDPATPTLIPSTAVPLYLYFDYAQQRFITTTDATLLSPRGVIGYLPR